LHLPLQVNLLYLIPLRLMLGVCFALCYITAGGYSYPWLQSMATQLGSYIVSVCVELRYRSLYKKLLLKESALAAALAQQRVASKLEGLHVEDEAASLQVRGVAGDRTAPAPIACSHQPRLKGVPLRKGWGQPSSFIPANQMVCSSCC